MAQKLDTTHVLMANELVIYRRERSTVWQCRYKVDGVWQRASTKQRNVTQAKDAAKELMIRAEIRKREGLPVVTRKFRDIAKLAIQRMRDKQARGEGKVSFNDYIRVIESHLIPVLGNRLITNIDREALEQLEAHRIKAAYSGAS
jgi:ribosomal protein L14